jgi:hypothetical protein
MDAEHKAKEERQQFEVRSANLHAHSRTLQPGSSWTPSAQQMMQQQPRWQL